MKPGIYDMPANTYHADPCPTPSLSASLVTVLLDHSPAHAFSAHPRLDGNRRFKNTMATDNGSLAHGLLFEGFAAMVEIDAPDYKTKVAQQARDAARADGKIPVLPKQVTTIKGMVGGARKVWTRTKELQAYAPEQGVGEQSIFWTETDERGNVFWFRCRPDWLANDYTVCIDGKFTDGSVRPSAFSKQVMRMDYHTRAAFYRRGIKAVFGTDADYLFLAAESAYPHEGAVLGLDPTFLTLGEQRVQEAIALWMHCMNTKKWPGYGDSIHRVEAPAWSLSDELTWDEEAPELETQA